MRNSLIGLVEMNRIELSTYALRTHRFYCFKQVLTFSISKNILYIQAVYRYSLFQDVSSLAINFHQKCHSECHSE